jgi:hypothetical protein
MALIAAVCVLGVIALVLFARTRWKRSTAREVSILSRDVLFAAERVARYDRSEIESLPAPVIRYFDLVLVQGQPMIARARIVWQGQFSLRASRWSSFSAVQHYRIRPPGFVWDARIRMASVVPVLVRDAYVDGEGSLHATIGGLVSVADHRGTPEMATGELLRYLSEAVWYPTALLPSAGVMWSAIDDSSATATVSDGATTVSMTAHFGPSGEITSLSAMRSREVGGAFVLTPWVAHVGGYAVHSDMRIPAVGDAEWTLPSGPLPYFRGTIVDVGYDFAR